MAFASDSTAAPTRQQGLLPGTTPPYSLPKSGASPAPALSSEASPTPAGVVPPHDPLADIEAEFAELIAQPWPAEPDDYGSASIDQPAGLLPRPAPRPSISTASLRRRAISEPAVLAAPLPNLRDALARRAAVFGPYDLDEPPAPPLGFLARCAAGLRSAADFLEPRAGRRQ